MAALRSVTLDELTIEDEGSVEHVALYARLKRALQRSGHRFLIPVEGAPITWDCVLFLNLTFWGGRAETSPDAGAAPEPDAQPDAQPDPAGADVLCNDHIAADEVGHVAWHHVVGRELASLVVDPTGPSSAEALFFSESIASAFDLDLIGRLLHDAPDSDFITTQVPLIAERAQDAGLSKGAFARLLEEIGRDPERAFEDMRELLLDVANALMACRGPVEAQRALTRFADHRFEPLLHHFEISNWILHARAYGARSPGPDAVVARLDALLRVAPTALGWLADHWVDADAGDAARLRRQRQRARRPARPRSSRDRSTAASGPDCVSVPPSTFTRRYFPGGKCVGQRPGPGRRVAGRRRASAAGERLLPAPVSADVDHAVDPDVAERLGVARRWP